MTLEIDLGAVYLGEGRCGFRVWAPDDKSIDVHIVSPREMRIPMKRDGRGYYSATMEEVEEGSLYYYLLNGEQDLPDPASRYQPRGVHGPSQIVNLSFDWEDDGWKGIPLGEYVIYELHVGTFTPEGTFEAIVPRLRELRELGINNIEIMPVSQFPDERNWGYDGVQPFAVQSSYGGPSGLMRLVNECHKQGIAVTLDVVYNHFGPEGNYLRSFGPYFTGKYNTPWGDALNFDDEHSDEVRGYFLQNALYWLDCHHIDALRLDAVHAIYDMSAIPFLQELATRVDELCKRDGRRHYLIAESDLNDSRLIRPRQSWGYGLDAQWSDDFHHALHALLTGESEGYYADFGRVEHLATSINDGYYYSGAYSPYRKRSHGNFAADLPPEQFVVAIQNHDQVGNRMLGERISSLLSFEAQKLAAAVLLLPPSVPLIFMGQEYGEEAPFLYFVSHTDPDLVEAVRAGRKNELKDFAWHKDPPDPEGVETFERSKLRWEKRSEGRHGSLLQIYRTLLHMRREIPALAAREREHVLAQAFEEQRVMSMRRGSGDSMVLCLFNFNAGEAVLPPGMLDMAGRWERIFDSTEERWDGPGTTLPEAPTPDSRLVIPPFGAAVYRKVK